MDLELYWYYMPVLPADYITRLSAFSAWRREKIEAARCERVKWDAYAASVALEQALAAHGIAECDCTYEILPGGKPIFANQSLSFSLSHTDGGALCALYSENIGADVEKAEAVPPAADALVLRYFTPCEAAYFQANRKTSPAEAFFRLWTRKESYVKYTGCGLASSLNNFTVLRDADPTQGVYYRTLVHDRFVFSVCSAVNAQVCLHTVS